MAYQATPGAPIMGYAGAPMQGMQPMQPGMYPNPAMGQQPVMIQPGVMPAPPPPMTAPGGRPPVQWMQVTASVPNCPPGLEYLAMVDQVLVHQLVEVFEVLTGWETANKYAVKNSLGQQCYFAVEETDFCTRQCCGPSRPFTIKVLDNAGREVMRVSRPCRCQGSCCPCCLQEVTIEAPPGNVVGKVEQEWTLCAPAFRILDPTGNVVLRIEGPCCPCKCFSDVIFRVKNADGSVEVGRITKQFSGLIKEYFTDADNFGVSFPMDLDVKCKATLLGACFLIDFMFFEDNQQNRH